MTPPLFSNKIIPELDRKFSPSSIFVRNFLKAAKETGEAVPVTLALEQANGSVFHYSTVVFPESSSSASYNALFIERLVKFLLWSRGGYRLTLAGPAYLADLLKKHYTDTATGRFDAEIMGGRIYEKPFEIRHVASVDALPAPKESTAPLGRHFKGCRIGFDLGASDRKVAAVIDGEVVFSEEVVWDPVKQSDPEWHHAEFTAMLNSAKAKLPRVDAIGGSAAGVYVDNRVKVASLFRGVLDAPVKDPVKVQAAKDVFLRLKEEWKVPFEVVNDGEVTALAGSISLNDGGVLGIALGSSEAVGYVTAQGNITSWLNELAFAPVDVREDAPCDEWSGDYGCGVQYFSQQCVNRLLAPAGIELPSDMKVPEKLKEVQALMAKGDERARKIYETIGVFMGYGVAHYANFYDIRHILSLGRVTTGEGGAIILEKAQDVLKEEFPELAEKITFNTPSERDKRHGQAIAAASLAVVPGQD